MAKIDVDFFTGISISDVDTKIFNRREAVRKWRKNHHEDSRKWYRMHGRDYYARRRLQVLQHYCQSDIPFCQCPGCHETILEFLGVDHVDGNGTQHRKKIGGGQSYNWLIRNHFPPGFQVLCHNCNQAKGLYGTCPHQLRNL